MVNVLKNQTQYRTVDLQQLKYNKMKANKLNVTFIFLTLIQQPIIKYSIKCEIFRLFPVYLLTWRANTENNTDHL